MPNGTIKKLTDKGFGFITPEDGSADLFFHHSQCGGAFDSLREGQKVSYNSAQGQKGPCAENVVSMD
jgi:CspA family cold shock protein